MKNYELNGNYYTITLDNDKKVKVAKKWVDTSIEKLDTDLEDVLLMWLEDNDYLVNEELEELDTKAKTNKVKLGATEKTERKKVVRERKPNPDKEYLVGCVAEFLEELNATDIKIENVGKIITFSYKNKQFKFDLTEKRTKKCE
jgi:hypothetical protein